MPILRPPTVQFNDRLFSSEELAAMALGWLDFLRDKIPPSCKAAGIALANHPQAVALFFALSSFSVPLIILSPDPRSWRSSPPIPPATPLFLPPSLRHLAHEGEAMGLPTHPVPDPRISSAGHQSPPFLTAPGVVTFTSGSTGPPKPVYTLTRSFLLQTASVVEAYRLSAGSGVVGALPLSSHFGLAHALFLPLVLGARLGLVERFDHRAVLALFTSGEYLYWAGTAAMADMLARAPLPSSHPPSPSICHISAGSLPESVFTAYSKRFGVPLRPCYGLTENGFITVEAAPPSEVRSDAVGVAAPGIEIRIGDDPRDPYPEGKIGRVWFSSPRYMEGYGYPTQLAPREGRDGWWPTEDTGALDGAGYLKLAGRIDDCFKTPSGYLVNPAEVAHALASHPSVSEVVVVPVQGAGEPTIGAIVEAAGGPDSEHFRAAAVRLLPQWLHPEVLLVTSELPRLPNGKVDRRACIAILEDARMGSRRPRRGILPS